MRNFKAIIEYDGTNYHGFQVQPGQDLPTIQGTLESCLMRVLKEPIKITGAGRTDAGVHAEGQVINFFTNTKIPLDRFPLAINCRLPDDIVIKGVEEVEQSFHARYDAKGKHYVYRIYNNRIPSVFHKRFTYFVPYYIDEMKIREGCKLLVGTYNFKAFTASGVSVKNFERTIYSLDLMRQGDLWEFHIQGNGFLYNMVRIIIGTLLELGKGKRDLASIKEALEKQDRTLAGQTAPAQGLCLKNVFYS
ncbi:MAG: tRNA pseudouridine38-40 synthase [Clostridia bacterium]|jgi:tRNA pseudouridine38-40 synthase|nr:tRNA pseudouridine38-40 synthase [Clostridia bacterium]MDN5323214.1 tRNA pseudouridine38-40 synthase [Clostridia bacterium]